MNSDFARIITLQRKERHISQKQAATDLGISQALLSHYEKGIRECGLNFLVKIADYYNVSCDYLLGRTPDPEGKTITVEDIPEDEFFHMTHLADKLMSQGRRVGMYPVSEDSFLDMGEFEEMHRMEEKLNLKS